MGEMLKDPLGKFQTFQEVSGTGIIGIPHYTVKAENTLRAVVSGAGAGNIVAVYGRIEGDPVFSLIGTISVNDDVTVDVSTTDYVRFVCAVFGGVPFNLAVSGFLEATAATSAISGEVHILAPTGPFKITAYTVTDAASNPLASALASRVSLSIRNKDPADIVYFGNASVTADNSATGGWEVGPNEDFNIDLDASNVFYLRTTTGNTALVKILEIAST